MIALSLTSKENPAANVKVRHQCSFKGYESQMSEGDAKHSGGVTVKCRARREGEHFSQALCVELQAHLHLASERVRLAYIPLSIDNFNSRLQLLPQRLR